MRIKRPTERQFFKKTSLFFLFCLIFKTKRLYLPSIQRSTITFITFYNSKLYEQNRID